MYQHDNAATKLPTHYNIWSIQFNIFLEGEIRLNQLSIIGNEEQIGNPLGMFFYFIFFCIRYKVEKEKEQKYIKIFFLLN